MEFTEILEDKRCNTLYENLIDKDKVHWKKFSVPDDIINWLRNFSNTDEGYLALILANNITYYNKAEIKTLAMEILKNCVKQYLVSTSKINNSPSLLEANFKNFIENECLFVGLGKTEDSGSVISYPISKYYSNSYNLKWKQLSEFLLSGESLANIKCIFLFDDFIGSGNQGKTFWNKRIGSGERECSLSLIKTRNPHLEFFYLALAGCKEGKQFIESEIPVKVILGEEFDDSYKCFSETSKIYTKSQERVQARQVMNNKGQILEPSHPLGYNNMQLAVAFDHNTPNNSLPVIWKRLDGIWHPLFERLE